MGISITTAGRIFKGQKKGHSGEEGFLVWEKFPHMGLVKVGQSHNNYNKINFIANIHKAYFY